MLNFITQPIKDHLARREWRKQNPHNATEMRTIFPIRFAKVGNYTYGDLNLIAYDEHCTDSILEIGNFVSISGNVTFLLSEQHQSKTLTSFPLKSVLNNFHYPEDALSRGSIVIEDEVWIGYGVTILSGIRVGKGSIIATGAVVTKDVPAYSIVGGVPGKVIKKRFNEEIIERLLKLKLVDLPREVLKNNLDLLYMDITETENLNAVEKIFGK